MNSINDLIRNLYMLSTDWLQTAKKHKEDGREQDRCMARYRAFEEAAIMAEKLKINMEKNNA